MAILGIVNKQPSEILDFDINYSPVLTGREDSLLSATATASPSGLTIVNAVANSANMTTQVIISEGVAATTYTVTVKSSTTGGLLYEDEVTVIVEET